MQSFPAVEITRMQLHAVWRSANRISSTKGAKNGPQMVARRPTKAQVRLTTSERIDGIKCVFNTAYTSRQPCIHRRTPYCQWK